MTQQMQSQFFEQAPLIRRSRKPRSERQIQRDIENYLISRDAVWSRTDCSYYSPQMRYNHKVTRWGWPDITVVHAGWFVGIEVKAADGVLSENQVQCRADIESQGGMYVVARSLSEVRQALQYCESNPK